MTRFCAIDVETANERLESICQIGLIAFEHGREVAAESWLVNPRDRFEPMNIEIHGITPERVKGAPTFQQLHRQLCDFVGEGTILVSHTHFERVAVTRACLAAAVTPPAVRWLDSARVTRRAWPQFGQSGFGLHNIASHLGIEFQHHDALEDARTAGQVLMAAIETSGIKLDAWLQRVERPIDPATGQPIRRTGDGDGPLLGERVVFTGALQITRREAADQAAEMGADVEPSVTKHTTLLVVGDQDLDRLAGHEKSSKHRKAEALIAKGQPIRILSESDWLALMA